MNSIRHPALLKCPATLRPILIARLYATQTGIGTTSSGAPRPRRKTVTPFNDDGRVAWGELSKGEKVARTTQQTFNFSFILLGAVMTAGVGYVMWTEVFSFDSKTVHFNKAVNQVKKDSRCTDLLGDSKKITAYGEPTWNKWARARPIASSTRKDQYGREHLVMHFNVEGPLNKGVVNLHMIKPAAGNEGGGEFVYKYLTLDVRGHQKIYLENADATLDSPAKNKSKIFGISWR
ncbi:hypothetical protein VTL71DRAFT_6988 [Oculimacula yallundae]|uniref:Mitochondrial import inner membrane translocase subunit Tim21 n=1 Tax=Oculimacula yallundae TaxID=86028 RepID=A0ABR4BWK4_9HELO